MTPLCSTSWVEEKSVLRAYFRQFKVSKIVKFSELSSLSGGAMQNYGISQNVLSDVLINGMKSNFKKSWGGGYLNFFSKLLNFFRVRYYTFFILLCLSTTDNN